MQVMPSTGRLLYRKENGKGRPDLRDPDANLRLGARYLRQLLDTFSGDTAAALAAYNAGPGRVEKGIPPRARGRVLRVDPVFGDAPLRQARAVFPERLLVALRAPARRGLAHRVPAGGGTETLTGALQTTPATLADDFAVDLRHAEQRPRIWWECDVAAKSYSVQTASWRFSMAESMNSMTFPQFEHTR